MLKKKKKIQKHSGKDTAEGIPSTHCSIWGD